MTGRVLESISVVHREYSLCLTHPDKVDISVSVDPDGTSPHSPVYRETHKVSR